MQHKLYDIKLETITQDTWKIIQITFNNIYVDYMYLIYRERERK